LTLPRGVARGHPRSSRTRGVPTEGWRMTAVAIAPRMFRVSEETTGEQVERRLARLGINQEEFAKLAGVHVRTLRKIRNDVPVEDMPRAKVLRTLDRLEVEYGIDQPEKIVNVVELPDGSRVVFEGSPEGVAEAAARFLRERKDSP
jgi:transcriptional regulator with XRE-family HTH domain